MNNPIQWLEIATKDLERAKDFYEKVFQIEIKVVDFGGILMGWFPRIESGPGADGSLVQQDSYVPSHEGTLVYFTSGDLQQELDRVEAAGGIVMQPKTQISEEHGYMGLFQDTEGNRIALHSNG